MQVLIMVCFCPCSKNNKKKITDFAMLHELQWITLIVLEDIFDFTLFLISVVDYIMYSLMRVKLQVETERRYYCSPHWVVKHPEHIGIYNAVFICDLSAILIFLNKPWPCSASKKHFINSHSYCLKLPTHPTSLDNTVALNLH